MSDIVSEVKICIDEIGLNDAEFLGTQDNEEMDTIIKSKISEALRFVNGNADWSLLEPNKIITDGTIEEDLVAHVACRRTTLGFVTLGYHHGLYLFQILSIGTIRNTPRCRIHTQRGHGKDLTGVDHEPGKTLELYKAKDKSDTFEIGIITDEDITDSLEVSPKLKKALIYYISGLTLLTYMDQHADSMFNQALVLMGVNPSGANSNQ